ncbi:MAG: hypothetical protein FGF52_03300 [Candidatus Brockarchaeota archaeon]|nr:hypothetical protein [Candidatus Brockarchaeota archaeon]
MVSRYAYSTHLLAWEFFNEVDLTDGYNPSNVASWHREMAEYLRSIDPYDHLITTSFSNPMGEDLIWRTSGLDFTQTHMYGPDVKDLAKAISMEIKLSLRQSPRFLKDTPILYVNTLLSFALVSKLYKCGV